MREKILTVKTVASSLAPFFTAASTFPTMYCRVWVPHASFKIKQKETIITKQTIKQ